MHFLIKPTILEDLAVACDLFDAAIVFQHKMGYPAYLSNDKEKVRQAIVEGFHFKVVCGDEIAAVFNVALDDKAIWLEKEVGDAVYLHHIIVNRSFSGNKMFGHILTWTASYASTINRKKIRLDTWAKNDKLRTYYASYGFEPVREITMPDCDEVSINCRGGYAVLMEYAIP